MVRLHVVALALLLAGTGCNGSDLSRVGGGSENSPNPDDGVDPSDPHNGEEEEDSVVPDVFITPDDTDGDGIPNADDNIPCMAFYLKIWNQNVSSAEVNINAQTIVEQSFFPTDEVIVEFVNPVPGINYIDFGGKVAGSPEDELHTELWDMNGTIYLHETIVRANGQPEEVSLSFDVNVTC